MSAICAISDESIARAVEIIRNGGVIVMPTDTVYGVACDPQNDDAINRIFEVKRRARSKSLQVLLSSIDDLEGLGLDLPAPLNRLSAAFLPGPFSPITLARKGCTLATLRHEADGSMTQAIRIPNSALSLRIIRATGPLAASSANRSGGESPQTAQEAYAAFGDEIALYLDGGATQGHVASTVVAADPYGEDGISVIREGVISQPLLRQALHINGGGLGA
jgi:tRNA threonylcarbamoyl adenosine modification protein (Sua5/YciO/YrdC/YwlC family)